MRTIGPYEVVRELGRGGMGVVYEVRHPGIPRPLALKLILGPADEQALARFAREAQVMARIRHPGVVTVHQLTRVAEGPILVTDLVQGRSLAQLVKEALPGTIAPRRAATLVRALADALEAVHAHGVLHRDLKPDNVIVRDDDTPVLLDFGLAREESAERLTQTGQLMGTPAYMSPEQAEGGSPTRVGPASDVYGLGAILFQPTSCEVIRVGPARAPEVVVGTRFPAMDLDLRGDLLAVVTARRMKAPDDVGEGELVVTRIGGVPLLELPLRTNGRRVELSPDGARVAVGLGGGFLDVYELPSREPQTLRSDAFNSTARGELFTVNTAHNALVNGLVFARDGKRLWSACGQSDLLEPWDGELRSWVLGAGTWTWVAPLTLPPGGTFEDRQRKRAENQLLASVVSLELSPDGRVLLLGTLAGEALLLAVPRDAR